MSEDRFNRPFEPGQVVAYSQDGTVLFSRVERDHGGDLVQLESGHFIRGWDSVIVLGMNELPFEPPVE